MPRGNGGSRKGARHPPSSTSHSREARSRSPTRARASRAPCPEAPAVRRVLRRRLCRPPHGVRTDHRGSFSASGRPETKSRVDDLTRAPAPRYASGMAVEHRFVETNGVRLHCAVDGEGPLVILLHGFPERWYSWRHQIAALAPRFRVVAPDLRGYNESDKPEGIAAYALPELVADVRVLIEAFGEREAAIVGHDWGGAIAWTF